MNRLVPVELLCSPGLAVVCRIGVVPDGGLEAEVTEVQGAVRGDKKAEDKQKAGLQARSGEETMVVRSKQCKNFPEF